MSRRPTRLSRSRNLVIIPLGAIKSILCNVVKFFYGFLFGIFMWWVMVQPYTRYYDFEKGSYLPWVIFSLIIATTFMVFLLARVTMVLFLPGMIGSATQNYIILLLIIALFSGPMTNLGWNTVESVRVIGCSLTMTFDQLKERAKLILNPVLEALNDKDMNVAPLRGELINIQQMVVNMRREAEFSRNLTAESPPPYPIVDLITPSNNSSWDESAAHDISKRLRTDLNRAKEIVNKTRELIKNATFEIDDNNFGIKAGIDVRELRNQLKESNITRRLSGSSIDDFNLTHIMYENCLGIFRIAKSRCSQSVEDMRLSCYNRIGPVFGLAWCSPWIFGLDTLCPWFIDQIVDETSLCGKLRESSLKIRIGSLRIGGGSDISTIYKNLTEQVMKLNDDLLLDENDSGDVPKRLELSISLNEQSKNIFLKTIHLLMFLKDKYKLRRLFYDILLFLYDLFTSYTFIIIMMEAYKYRKNYLSRIRFDNHYITRGFKKIDSLRRSRGEPNVLPLTKVESNDFITTFTCKRRTKEEKKSQKASCTITIVFLAFTLSLIYFDDIIDSILSSVHEHALIKINEIGHHSLNITILGEGSIARLVKKLTSRLNSTYSLDRDTSTEMCLPVPKKTGTDFYLRFFYLGIMYLIIDQISIYAMRLRHITCAFFYPTNEQERIIYLYNLILMRRESLKRSGKLETELAALSEGTEQQKKVKDDDDDNDEPVFTLRDAFSYLGNCVSDSIGNCNHPLFRRCHRSRRQAIASAVAAPNYSKSSKQVV